MLAATTPTALPRGRGTVFLLHVHQASGQVGHFVGCAVDVQAHLERLRAGGGPPLIRAAVAAGVDLELACTWSGGRAEPLGNPSWIRAPAESAGPPGGERQGGRDPRAL